MTGDSPEALAATHAAMVIARHLSGLDPDDLSARMALHTVEHPGEHPAMLALLSLLEATTRTPGMGERVLNWARVEQVDRGRRAQDHRVLAAFRKVTGWADEEVIHYAGCDRGCVPICGAEEDECRDSPARRRLAGPPL